MRLFAIFVLVSFVTAAICQPVTFFRATYNATTNHQDDGVAVVGNGLGGCFSAGTAYESATGTYDAQVVAYDPQGVRQWVYENRLPGESEKAKAIKRNPVTGEVLLLSVVSGGGGPRVRLLTLGANGSFHHQTDLSTGTTVSVGYAPSLQVDGLGNAYIAAVRSGDYLIAKIDSIGNPVWEKTLDFGPKAGTTSDLAISPFGDVYVTGIVSQSGGYVTAKYSAQGDFQWADTFLGHHGATLGPAFIQCLASGDPIMCTSPEDSFGVPQYAIYRLSSKTGQHTWLQTYDPNPQLDAEAGGLALDRSGNAYVVASQIAGQARTILVKYDLNGSRIWEKSYVGGSPTATGVTVDAFGNPVLCGFAGVTTTGLLVGYNPAGTQLWVSLRTSDRYEGITSDGRHGIFVIGTAFNSSTNDDFVTVKLLNLPLKK